MSEKLDKALATIERDYQADVNQWAKDFDERIADGEFEDRDHFIETFDQEIDGAARVIYTHKARLGLLVSENEGTGIEELGVESFDFSSGIPYSQLMYFAFRQDILERMESDVNDDETFEPEDDED